MASTETTTRTLPTLHEFFAPGGILARSPLPYEYRPGQLAMAKAVERALQEHRHLIVEAGTGTGKTLAYLLPALRTGQRVIVSTGTKALQDQLYFRDMPFLETLLGDLRVCYMKGRANYLCRHKLVALRDQPILSGLEEIDQYRQIAEWEQTTETGDRAELAGMPESSALWNKLDARGDACLGRTCPDYRRCFITEMRRKALESDIIIVNHHLFFADLAVKQEAAGAPDAGILPEAAAVVFDEAHELEEVASSYFGLSVSNMRFEELARDTDVLLRGKEGAERMPAVTQQLRERARMFFAGAAGGRGWTPAIRRSRRVSGDSGDLYVGVRATLRRLEGEMEDLKGVDEAPGLKKRVARLRRELEFLMESNDSNMVYWLERRVWAAESNARTAGTPIRGAGRGPRFCRPRRSMFPSCCTRWCSNDSDGGADLGHADGAGRVRAHAPAAGADGRRASWWCRRISATASRRCCICRRRCPTRASRSFPRLRRTAFSACWRSRAAAPFASSRATARCATSTSG